MKLHSIDPETGALKTKEVDPAILGDKALAKLARGRPIFRDGRWVLPTELWTPTGTMVTAGLLLTAGCDKGTGKPGSGDAHWVEARVLASEPWVHRSNHVVVRGLVRKAAVMAGQLG